MAAPAMHSLYLSINASATGVIYCQPLRTSATFGSIASIKLYGTSVMIFDTSQLIGLALNHLDPETDYNIYCYTEDNLGHGMPLSEVFSGVVTASTSCCRSVSFIASSSLVPQYFPGSPRSEPIFVVALNSVPTDSLALKASVFSAPDCSSTGNLKATLTASAFPVNFYFKSNSLDLTASFVVRGTSTGK
jgi:hypothetical protein